MVVYFVLPGNANGDTVFIVRDTGLLIINEQYLVLQLKILFVYCGNDPQDEIPFYSFIIWCWESFCLIYSIESWSFESIANTQQGLSGNLVYSIFCFWQSSAERSRTARSANNYISKKIRLIHSSSWNSSQAPRACITSSTDSICSLCESYHDRS